MTKEERERAYKACCYDFFVQVAKLQGHLATTPVIFGYVEQCTRKIDHIMPTLKRLMYESLAEDTHE